RVDVAADQHGVLRLAAEREPLVAGGIDRLLRPGLAHFPAQPLARALPGVRPRHPLRAALVARQLLELAQLRDGTARVERHGANVTRPSPSGRIPQGARAL